MCSSWASLRRLVFPTGIAIVSLGLVTLWVLVGATLAIQGAYLLVGLLLGAAVHYGTETRRLPSSPGPHAHRYAMITISLALLTLVATIVLESRLLPFLLVLPGAYLAVALQLRDVDASAGLLGQVVLLFVTVNLAKYLDTYFYFGNNDTLKHTESVSNLLTEQSISGIATLYQQFPGFHMLIGTASSVAGLPSYDALMLIGIAVNTTLVVLVYRFVIALTDDEALGLSVAFAVTVLYLFPFFTTYFFPQSLGVALCLFFLYLVVRWTQTGDPREAFAAIVVGIAFMFTHHLTLLLVMPLVVAAAVPAVLAGGFSLRDQAPLRFLLIAVLALSAFYYWIYIERILPAVVVQIGVLLNTVGSSVTQTSNQFWFGAAPNQETMVSALQSLLSVVSVYDAVTAAVLVLGIVGALVFVEDRRRTIGLVFVSLVAGVFMLDIPISFKGFTRVRHPLTFFAALPIGLGVHRLRQTSTPSWVGAAVAVALLILLGTFSPLMVADDVTALQSRYPPEKSLSSDELSQLDAASRTLTETDADVATDWVSMTVLARNGFRARQVTVAGWGLRSTADLVFYRTTWSDHRILVQSPLFQARFIVVEEVLSPSVAEQSKVYTSGMTGMVWDDGDGTTWPFREDAMKMSA